MRLSLLCFFMIALFFGGCASPGLVSFVPRYTDNVNNIEHLEESVVSLVEENSEEPGGFGSYCSGFYVSPRRIATASHCTRPRLVVPGIGVLRGPPVTGTAISFINHSQFVGFRSEAERRLRNNPDAELPNYHPLSSRVVAVDRENDVAILEVDEAVLSTRNFLRLETRTLRQGQTVYSMGNPAHLQWLLTQGLISRVLRNEFGQVDEIIASAPIFHGNSGGPLVNEFGEVVGLTVAFGYRQPHLGIHTPIRHVAMLLETLH